MVDSTPAELLNALQTMYTNYQANLANQRTKGVIINGEALEVKLLYNPSNDQWSIMVHHVLTGLSYSDVYTDYATALNTYINIS